MDKVIKVILTAQVIIAVLIAVLALIGVLMGNTWQIVMVFIYLGIAYLGLYSIIERADNVKKSDR